MTYTHAKDQRSFGSKDMLETNGRTELTALPSSLTWWVTILH